MPKVAEQVVPADPLDRSNFGSKEQRTAFPIERRDIFQRAAELCRSAAKVVVNFKSCTII
jgi:hypothetical protein